MNRYLPIIIAAWLLVGCKPSPAPSPSPARKAKGAFTDIVRLPMTPVKDQGSSSLCWAYAMLAVIESEHLAVGDSVNLSTDYVARQYLMEQTRRRYLSGGRHSIDHRGMMPMLIHLIHRYGAEPESTYHIKGGRTANYHVLGRQLARIADTSRSLAEAERRADTLFDQRIGFLPRFVFLYGAEYTPLEFAHSVCRRHEYELLTSFTHHPFGERFALETPDNRMDDEFLNVPLDTLMHTMEHTLLHGHAVGWEGDISEEGFSFERGVATLPAEKPCTQAERQRAFETRKTTDDHCMALIGMARDAKGRRYFIAKNSWGTANPYGGLMYLSEDYVRLKTIAIVVGRE